MNTPPVVWPGASEPLPEIHMTVAPGDSLHRVALRNATEILLIDAGTEGRPPVALVRWAFTVFRHVGRVPQA